MADAEGLTGSVNSTKDLSERVSSKVRELDGAQVRFCYAVPYGPVSVDIRLCSACEGTLLPGFAQFLLTVRGCTLTSFTKETCR